MTNGEKLQSVFPDTKIITQFDNPFGDMFILFTLNNEDMQVNIEWWNAEYKELPTKNNLGVEHHKQNIQAYAHDFGVSEEQAKKELRVTTKNDLAVETTQMIDKSNFSQEQYKADLQSAYDCGYAQAKNNLGVDCISRTQAQTEIEMNASRYTIAKERGGMGQVEWSDQLIKVSDAVDIIRNLPSVTPQEPKIGHWIPTYGNVKCSVCGSVKDSREVGKSTHYCDFCGAKMESEDDNE